VRAGLDRELTRVGIGFSERIGNPQPELGMFSSVRCAARWTGWRPGLTHWLLTLGDQPHVENATLQALLDFGAQHPDKVCQPSRAGRPRHPVLLPGIPFREIAAAPANDLKQFLLERPERRLCFESSDSGLDFDLDEPLDYERALRLCAQKPGGAHFEGMSPKSPWFEE
jgi:CTP:molybdopterin cytidylyltransferase MocA